MNQVLALVRSARSPAAPELGLRSEGMLVELLALHEDTLAQLHLERLGAVEASEFLNGMIEQHELAARRLRVQLEMARENGDGSRTR
jgi:hypothetical protein